MAGPNIPKPGEPVHLSQLLLQDLRFPAVYFLYHAGEVVYVGQSRTLKCRIDTHLTEGVKEFEAVAFIRCRIDQLTEFEGYWIKRLGPKYNDCLIARASKKQWPPMAANDTQGMKPADNLSFEEAARFLGVEIEWLVQWRHEGLLPPPAKKRCGRSRARRVDRRFPRAALTAFVAEHPELIAEAKRQAA